MTVVSAGECLCLMCWKLCVVVAMLPARCVLVWLVLGVLVIDLLLFLALVVVMYIVGLIVALV